MNLRSILRGFKRRVRIARRNLAWAIARVKGTLPELPYVETHLTDHCNFKCKGCGHFCPIADEWYADISVHCRDMKRLAQLFSNISTIRLLGGEPLLHPEICRFMEVTRECFPRSNIRIVTNGILLRKMSASFWRSCKSNGIKIDLTLYPAFEARRGEWETLAANHGIPLNVGVTRKFFAHLNLRGDSDPNRAQRICSGILKCRFLREGYIYRCPQPPLVKYFNKAFSVSIPTDGGVNIHHMDVSGAGILETFTKPIGMCRYCSYDFPYFDWGISKGVKEEWDARNSRRSG